MKVKPAKSFEDLITNYYGVRENLFEDPATAEELFASYYGRPLQAPKAGRKTPVVVSLCCDDGEKLVQRRRKKPAVPVYRATGRLAMSVEKSLEKAAGLAYQAVNPAREIEIDLCPEAPGRTVVEPVSIEPSSRPLAPEPVKQAAPAKAEVKKPEAGSPADDDIAADLQAILSGKKVYDPVSGKTVEKGKVNEVRSAVPTAPLAAPPPAPAGDGQVAIFDRIAQSMQYANAYDLGTVELENRFADFDRMEELRRKALEGKRLKSRAPMTPPKPAAKPGAQAFLEDLDAIRNAPPVPAPAEPPVAEGLSLAGDVAEALYDTGEHVMAAEALYKDQLTVGPPPGVKFSYGQIIAMGDMYESVNQMNTAATAELQKLKTLIEQSTTYYAGGKKGVNVTNPQWDDATAGRFLKLAEDNYDHFAPNILFKGAVFAKKVARHGDHKTAWERHHKWAIDESAKDSRIGTDEAHIPQWPLVINAFGDHFMTDAFAAGHLVNKEGIIDYYKASFYSSGRLTGNGRAFFDKVAERAFTGDVKKRFSELETYEPYDAWWNVVDWNPNIDSASRFASLLAAIAEREPDKIGNLAIKALHDKLNKDGVEVTNQAGSGTWQLTGDGYLTTQTLTVMRQAVLQSVANVLDLAVRTGKVALADAYSKVWQYVPQFTAKAEAVVKAWATTYVEPTSATLVDAAARLIRAELDTLIKALLDKKALKAA
jgi:hypothetical protein